ncbi:hypothetical protein [Pilimelia columellifera]|uniref:Lipoprotein n=1 Tax=Pilimelia columellifera subsp. columellifera TaxID=706583 RepID=A0ABP6AWE8_9ACTN
MLSARFRRSASVSRAGVRRLTSFALVATLGLLTLTGCRSDPSVAVYAGGQKLTEAKLDQMMDELLAKVPAEQRQPDLVAGLRGELVRFFALTAAAKSYAATTGQTLPAGPVTEIGARFRLPETAEVVQAAAQGVAAVTMFDQAAEKANPQAVPTEDDRRDAYAQLRGPQGEPTGLSYAEARPLLTDEALAKPVTQRELIEGASADVGVSINPRYDRSYPVQLVLDGQKVTAVDVHFGPAGAVVQAPPPAPAGAPGGGHDDH